MPRKTDEQVRTDVRVIAKTIAAVVVAVIDYAQADVQATAVERRFVELADRIIAFAEEG